MAQLRRDYREFTAKDAEVIVAGPEDREAFRDFWVKEELPFIGLPDPDHSLIDLYGQEVKLLKFGRMPAQMVIDKQGIVIYAHYGQSMSDIPANEDILQLI